MTTEQNHTFLTLLRSWNGHQDLRDAQAPLAELAESRSALDAARLDACQQFAQAL